MMMMHTSTKGFAHYAHIFFEKYIRYITLLLYAEEWSEFVGDDETGDVYDPRFVNVFVILFIEFICSSVPAPGDEDDYEGLDPDIELEMEAFIDEIEEHLMLQDFDPDLH